MCPFSLSLASNDFILQFYRPYEILTTIPEVVLGVAVGKMIEELDSFLDQDLIPKGRTSVMAPSSIMVAMNALSPN